MKLYAGTVEDGLVKLPAYVRLPDGSKVVLAVVSGGGASMADSGYAPIEAEDIEFVRACRGRITQHMRDEDDG